VLTSDEITAADRLFAELMGERDPQSPVVDIIARAARPSAGPVQSVAAAS